MPDIIQGQTRQLAFVCEDFDGNRVDPSIVRVIFKNRTSKTTYVYGTDAALVRDGLGEYHANVSFSVSGPWKLRVELEGGFGNAWQDDVYVAPTIV